MIGAIFFPLFIAMITLNKISKSFGSRTLFEDVTMTFEPGKRYALTGPNGAGKTTMLKIMMGDEEPTSGSVTLPKRVGILRQNINAYASYTAVETVVMGNKRLWNALQERDKLYLEEMTDTIGMRLGDLESIIGEEDGYSAEANAELLLEGMGMPPELFHATMSAIPTDMQFRALLCQALFGQPEALLLDEPTNHLDLESIGWLETFLLQYRGVLIVISHDRHFLNAVTTHVADIDYETIILYPGNYDDMVEAKTAVRQRAEDTAKSKEKKISQLREFVARFGAGTRASQVQSRLREIDKLQPPDLKKTNIQRPYIRLMPSDKSAGKVVLRAHKLAKNYEGRAVIKNFGLEIHRGDKIGVIGNNGRGKTTLLKLLAGMIKGDGGLIEMGHNVQVGYFPQNHAEVVDKSDKQSAFEWLKQRKSGIYDQDIRSALGKMLFGGDDAFKSVNSLSGGETARLILAGIMLSEHNALVLDEPNNHLDLEAVSALAEGLKNYDGTVLVASHDRDLIGTVATKLIAFEEKGIHIFDGPLEEYLQQQAPKK